MFTAAGIALGAALGLLLGTLTMSAAIAGDREQCLKYAQEQSVATATANELCDHRIRRRKVRAGATDPVAWQRAVHRAERRLRRRGRI